MRFKMPEVITTHHFLDCYLFILCYFQRKKPFFVEPEWYVNVGSWASDLQKATAEGVKERKRIEVQLHQLETNLKRKIGITDVSPPNKETSTRHWSEVERFNNLFS